MEALPARQKIKQFSLDAILYHIYTWNSLVGCQLIGRN